jgi:DNA adenine methylase
MKRYDRPHTLFYLDPPYWETEGYGVPFPWEEYEAMAERMRNLQGKAVLSINDHPAIRGKRSANDTLAPSMTAC